MDAYMGKDDMIAVMKAQRKIQWDDFTADTAQKVLVAMVRGGYSSNDYTLYASRAVRFAKELTSQLKLEEENESES